MVIQHSLFIVLLTALIFYPRTSQIQVLFALFWEKQKRCLICAEWINLIIFGRSQSNQAISPTVLLPKMLSKHTWISLTSISALLLHKVPSLLHFLTTRATWSTIGSAHLSKANAWWGSSELQSRTMATYDDAPWFDKKIWSSQAMLSSRWSIELLCLIVQGITNSVDRVINGDNGKFDRILGPGSAKEISDVIGCCFNMDSAKPTGCKIGLIDEYHVWCFQMDPFNYEWRITFVIDGNMIWTHTKNMIAHFVSTDGIRRNESVRNDLLSEFEVRSSACAI